MSAAVAEPALRSGMSWEELRDVVGQIAECRSEWAGLPLITQGHDLIVEKKFPYQFTDKEKQEPDSQIVNQWFSQRLRCDVVIERYNGKLQALRLPSEHGRRFGLSLGTLGVQDVWDVRAEMRALSKLESMTTERQFSAFFLTGMFIERSKRSGIHYVFRRLRPTVALSTSTGTTDILCAICLHPIGWYTESHAGAMVPTDDVIAHLSLMRGDEHRFWKHGNQHHPERAESGI